MAAIDSCWAADILAGCLSPMTVLERRLKHPLPELISAAATAIGKRPLRRVTWRKRLRRQPGPILVPYGQAKVTMHFAFDRICGPGNEIEYEIDATAVGIERPQLRTGALPAFLACRNQLASFDRSTPAARGKR